MISRTDLPSCDRAASSLHVSWACVSGMLATEMQVGVGHVCGPGLTVTDGAGAAACLRLLPWTGSKLDVLSKHSHQVLAGLQLDSQIRLQAGELLGTRSGGAFKA